MARARGSFANETGEATTKCLCLSEKWLENILSETMEYTEERDRDFMNAYRREVRRAWEETGQVDRGEVLRRAIEGGAPGFYVEFEYARRGVSARLRHRLRSRHRDYMRPKRMIWEDLADRVMSEMTGSRVPLRLGEALARVLAEGNAPRFYIEPRTARRIVSRMIMKTRLTGK